MQSLEARLTKAAAETDQNRKNLLVAEIVSELLRAAGADPVIVGGSAVEFYTDGAYLSGDVDVCFSGGKALSPRQRESVLAEVGTSLGVRLWKVAGVVVDLLGPVETSAHTPFQVIGSLKLIQIEDLIAERLLIATVPQFDAQRWQVAKVLLSVALSGLLSFDRAELERIAAAPEYRVDTELRQLLDEIARESANSHV